MSPRSASLPLIFDGQLLELAHGRCPSCEGPVTFADRDSSSIVANGARTVRVVGRCRVCDEAWTIEVPDPFYRPPAAQRARA